MCLIRIKTLLAKVTNITGGKQYPCSAGKAFQPCKIKMYNLLPTVKGTQIISVSKTYTQGIFDI